MRKRVGGGGGRWERKRGWAGVRQGRMEGEGTAFYYVASVCVCIGAMREGWPRVKGGGRGGRGPLGWLEGQSVGYAWRDAGAGWKRDREEEGDDDQEDGEGQVEEKECGKACNSSKLVYRKNDHDFGALKPTHTHTRGQSETKFLRRLSLRSDPFNTSSSPSFHSPIGRFGSTDASVSL